MALSASELVTARNFCATRMAVAYTKPQINAALQAIDTAMTSRAIVAGDLGKTIQLVLSAEIDAASAFSFTNAQKKLLFAIWAQLKYLKDSI